MGVVDGIDSSETLLLFQASSDYLHVLAPQPASSDGSDPRLIQRLELSFPVNGNHFSKGKNVVKLKCLASIADVYWKSSEISILQEKPKFASVMEDDHLSSEVKSKGGVISSSSISNSADMNSAQNAGKSSLFGTWCSSTLTLQGSSNIRTYSFKSSLDRLMSKLTPLPS